MHLGNFKRFSGATWGPDLLHNRTLYHGKIFATIGYAAAAWFSHIPGVPGHSQPATLKFGISRKALEQLKSLQIECVLSLSGARKGTSFRVLENEMHITPILYKLHEIAMNHRCQQHQSAEYRMMETLRVRRFGCLPRTTWKASKPILDDHPFQVLRRFTEHVWNQLRHNQRCRIGDHALEVQWKVPEKRKAIIKDFNQECSYYYTSKLWECYQRGRYRDPSKIMHVAHMEDFGEHRLRYYCGLSRAQSTMAIMMRTGNIALKSNKAWRLVNDLPDDKCVRCGKYVETVEHLLCHCKALHIERQLLEAAVGGRLNFHSLMTTDLELASAWAIRYFDLEQFEAEKKAKRYQFPRKRTHIVRKPDIT
jgi:hypothetical protein